MCDIDGMFDRHQPVALLDWKHEQARWKPTDASLRAIANLANGYRSTRCPDGLPFLVVRYRDDDTAPTFEAHAMNAPAAALLDASGSIDGTADGCPYRTLDAAGFVQLAGRARGLPLPAVVRAIAGATIGTTLAADARRIPRRPAA